MRPRRSTRRDLLRFAALAGAGALAVRAEDLPRLDERDPAARALLYVHDADRVDQSSPIVSARWRPGQRCAGCAYLGGDGAAAWRPCSYFPGYLVSARGWCSVWTARN